MADTTYQDALKRREVLKRELKKLNDFIELYEEIFGTEAEQASHSLPFEQPKPGETQESAPPPRRKNPPRQEIGRRAREVILSNGTPMTRGELLNALAARGMQIVAANPPKAMGTIMWRLRRQFVNLEGYGYWPKDVPCAVVGYSPADGERLDG